MERENEDAQLAAKEPLKRGLRYMARYMSGKPQIARVMGQEIVEIYARRGFTEISKEHFDDLAKSLKEG